MRCTLKRGECGYTDRTERQRKEMGQVVNARIYPAETTRSEVSILSCDVISQPTLQKKDELVEWTLEIPEEEPKETADEEGFKMAVASVIDVGVQMVKDGWHGLFHKHFTTAVGMRYRRSGCTFGREVQQHR